jgi:hypothetical protein
MSAAAEKMGVPVTASVMIFRPTNTRIANQKIRFLFYAFISQRQRYATAPVANPESPP